MPNAQLPYTNKAKSKQRQLVKLVPYYKHADSSEAQPFTPTTVLMARKIATTVWGFGLIASISKR